MKFKAAEHAGLIGALATILIIGAAGLLIGMERIKEVVEHSGPLAPLAFIALKASTVIIAPLSGGPVYPLVGALFGYWPGILYAVIGDFIGYTGAFYIARVFGKASVDRLIDTNERGLLARTVRHMGSVKGLIHACFTSFAMPELICYAAGLSRIRYATFILVLMPLSVIAASVLVFAGALLGEESLLLSLVLPGAALLVMLAGGWLFVRGVREK